MSIKRGDKFVRIAPSSRYYVGEVVKVSRVDRGWVSMEGGVTTQLSCFFNKWRAIKPIYWENK